MTSSLLSIVFCFVVFGFVVWLLNIISYVWLKKSTLNSRQWDLNICCGKTDGGGINADIFQHTDVSNFVHLDDINSLPFIDNQFEWVLCSHTAEHVDDPDALERELQRVGKNVVYVLPPLWDIGAVFNIFEHRWIFLSVKKTHSTLPKRVRLPLSATAQRWLGQRIAA